jgi:hypothetical protein
LGLSIIISFSMTNLFKKSQNSLFRAIFISINFYIIIFIFCLPVGKLSHNVPVVYDVFTVAIKECVSIPATVKMWRRKTPQRRLRRLRFFGAQAPKGRSVYNPVICSTPVFSIMFHSKILFPMSISTF